MRTRLMLVSCCVLAALLATMASAQEVVIKVDGKSKVASLADAAIAVRQAKKANAGKPIVVEFAEGEYALTEPVAFTPEDSGSESAPITYRAVSGAKVTFSGGKKIAGWTKQANGVWTTKVPEVAEGKWYFEQLYVNGHRATRCRTPNAPDYLYTARTADSVTNPETGEEAALPNRSFHATRSDVAQLESLSTNEMRDVMFTVYHSWETSAHRVAWIDFKTGEPAVVFTGDASWPMMQWEPRQRYHIENFYAALDVPGEWFLERATGTLSYIPREGEDPNKIEIVAPIATAFLTFKGNTAKDDASGRVEHIKFENLRFRHTAYTLPPQGFSVGQAASTLPFAVDLDGCRNVAFEGCEFGCGATNGVRFHQACNDCKLTKSYVHDIGGGGVYIGTGWEPNLDAMESTDRNTVENCIVCEGGQFDMGGVGLWIGHGSYNTLRHNDVSEFYYTGISCGWQWGYAESRSHHNTIEFNRVHNLGHWVMSDMGGIYTLGISPGTVVRNNVFHDIYAYSYGGWGLYTDEGSTGIVLENNLVYRVKTGTFHQHYGKENIIRNNILAYSLTDQVQRTRVEEHLSFTLENNIFYWDEGVLFGTPWSGDAMKHWGDDRVVTKQNLYWNPNADMAKVFPSGLDLAAWQKQTGHDEGSIVADPKFRDPKHGDFTLPDDSPAFKVGFKRFDYEKAGVYGDAAWVKFAKNYPHPERPLPPPKPEALPVIINENFETPRTVSVPKATISDEGRSDLIRVVGDDPFSGTKCLRVGDANDLKQGFNPHFHYDPRYKTGRVAVSFAVRVEPNALPYIELRDSSSPYKAGPTFRIAGGKLQLHGVEPIDFPVGAWVRFDITATLGDAADGTWQLQLTFPDGTEKRFDKIACVQPDWKSLNWFGFCNLAATDDNSAFFVDAIECQNAE
ncbi:MAG: right-handed parallel beta-helix repeat-containing protein [Thermoguttaceae bacterium]